MAIVEIEMRPITKKKDVIRLYETLRDSGLTKEAIRKSDECEKLSGSLTKKKKK